MSDAASVARRAIGLLDLTDLTDDCTAQAIDRLCDRAVTPHGAVAAVCLFPRFVAQAKARLAGGSVKVATVVNFPAGGENPEAVEAETAGAIAEGADEIDLVLPWRAFADGRRAVAERMVERIRRATPPPVRLKVILETGMLREPGLIRAASDLALEAGADFLKTSTGKVAINATPEAAETMLAAIRASGRPAGFKAAGGIRTTADAGLYLGIADRIMGPGWATADTFRFGASGLLDDLLATLGGGAPAAPPSAY